MTTMDDRVKSPSVILLSNLSNLVDSHIAEAVDDVCQARLILDEAIIKLECSFYGIQYELAQQQGMPEMTGREMCLDRLTAHLHQAIIGLQFHDLTTQLLQRVNARFDGLRDMLVVMDSKKTIAYGQAEDLTLSLREADETLSALNVKLQGALSKSLRQEHMGCGDVELF